MDKKTEESRIAYNKIAFEYDTDILSALHKANTSIYGDSMQLLVHKDIQKALNEIQNL